MSYGDWGDNAQSHRSGGSNVFMWLIIIVVVGLMLSGIAGGDLFERKTTFTSGGGQNLNVQSGGQSWGVVGGTWQNRPQNNGFSLLQRMGTFPTPVYAPQNYVQQCAGVPGPCPDGFYVWPAARQTEWLRQHGGQ